MTIRAGGRPAASARHHPSRRAGRSRDERAPARQWGRPCCARRASSRRFAISAIDVEDRGDLAPAAVVARGRARRQGASVRGGRGLGAAAGARDLCDRALRADADRARRRSQHRDGLDSAASRATRPRRGASCFVLWLDAHSDFNTPLTSPSGNMHGMSLAMLCREPGLEGVFGDEPHGSSIPGGCICSASARSIRANGDCCRTRGVDVVDMRQTGRRRLRRLDPAHHRRGSRPQRPSACQPGRRLSRSRIAPGVGTAVPGGATYREAHLVMELLLRIGSRRPRSTSSNSIRSSTSARKARSCLST